MSKGRLTLAVVVGAGMIVWSCAVSRVLAVSDDDERKLVEDMFGKKIVNVKATPADDDDIELAKQLLLAANDTTSSKTLRFLLARKSLELTLPIGTDESGALAMKAMELADQLGALTKLEKAIYVREMSAKVLARAKGGDNKKTFEYMAALARAAADADIQYCRMAMDDEANAAEVTKTIADARSHIQTYKLTDMVNALDELEKQTKAITAKRNGLRDVLAKLEVAKKSGDAAAIKLASRNVAQAYLELDSDIRTAAKYMEGTDDPRAKGLSAAASFLEDPRAFDIATVPDILDAIQAAASKLPDIPKGNVATVGMKMAQAYLDSKPSDISAAKVKLQMIQLKSLTAGMLADKLRKDLIASYGSMAAKVEVVGEDRVRMTYDFSTQAQLADWEKTDGTWEIGNNVLGCRNVYNGSGTLKNKIIFRRDKPIKVSFNCAGRYEFGLSFLSPPATSSSSSVMDGYEYYDRFYLYTSGLRYSGYYESFSEPKARLDPGKDHKFEVAWDGKGTWTCTVNGQVVREVKLRDMPRSLGDSFRIALFTEEAIQYMTTFDNVVIEGSVVVDPKTKKPDETSTDTVKPIVKPTTRPATPKLKPVSKPAPTPSEAPVE